MFKDQAFPVGGTGKNPQVTVSLEAGVNMSAFSVFRAEQLLRELSDQGFDDARHLLSDLAGTRSEL